MLSVVARCEGGMRTGDLHLWDWTMIDRLHFARVHDPASKTEAPQVLAIPFGARPLSPGLVGARGASPRLAPSFPFASASAPASARARSNSYAKRLRRALFQAGVVRLPPVEVPATKSGTRTDLARRARGPSSLPTPSIRSTSRRRRRCRSTSTASDVRSTRASPRRTSTCRRPCAWRVTPIRRRTCGTSCRPLRWAGFPRRRCLSSRLRWLESSRSVTIRRGPDQEP